MSKKKDCGISCRLGKVGGQAVLEGVMMKAGQRTVTTCRKEDGSIVVNDDSFVSVRKKHKILNLPIVRGVVNMIEMLMDTYIFQEKKQKVILELNMMPANLVIL
jgi:uncharacterized protein YqhQ